jgi:hypothetical protein
MQNQLRNVSKLLMSMCFLALVFLSACKDDDDDKNTNEVKFQNISVTGAQEVPPTPSNATGTFNGTYNKTTKMLTYTLTWTGMTPVAMHFHKGAVGTAPPNNVVLPIDPPYTSPKNATTRALTAAEEADLLAGLWYVNLHSATYPAGEIRGQLTP